MSLKVKRKKASNIPPLSEGIYSGILLGVIDIGEQYSELYKKYASKLMFIFEIPDQVVEVDGERKPRWLSKEFSASLNEKSNLFKTLNSLLGRTLTDDELSEGGTGFDLKTLAGRGCILTVAVVEKEENKYNNITQISGIPAGLPAPTTQSPLLIYDIDEPNEVVFAQLPEWIQDKIRKSTQFSDNPKEQILDPDAIAAQSVTQSTVPAVQVEAPTTEPDTTRRNPI